MSRISMQVSRKQKVAADMLFKTPVMLLVALLVQFSQAITDPNDVAGLQVLFTSLNSPGQLTSWVASNGDPCGQSWLGVKCRGSSVIEVSIPNLQLSGTLGYQLTSLTSLTLFDVSNNVISGTIPYQLPPNLETLNLGNNHFADVLPYSISQMTKLTYLNASHNQLSGSLSDMFSNLTNLKSMDLSFNSISGSLPQSFVDLTSLTSLFIQNNQFSGDLNVIADLKFENLEVENNQFTGWIPTSFNNIPNFKSSGNSFSSSPAPPPPPFTPPPPAPPSSSNNGRSPRAPSSASDSGGGGGTVLNGGAIAGIVIACILGIIVVILIIMFFCWKPKENAFDEEKQPIPAVVALPVTSTKGVKENVEQRPASSPTDGFSLKPPPLAPAQAEALTGKKPPTKRAKHPITASAFSVADLQLATNSFSQENLVGEGTLGRVYKAELPDGKLLAVKKIDITSSSSIQKEEDFMDVISNISRLRHGNIAELVGYCTEHGQRLLVYEFLNKGALSDVLHVSDEAAKQELTWNVRVKVALGSARALEYLHEVCQPSVVHKNFKSANILLDDELNPHLSDCGIAAFSPSPERQVSTQMTDSFGYSAPEYAMSGIYTWKSDVYSFGVVMLELLTGRKPLDSERPRIEQSLVRWATPQLHDIDALAKMVDPALKGMYPAKSLSRFADIIAQCVQPEPEFRPPMSEVVQSLVRLMQRATLSKRRSGDEQKGLDNHDLADGSL
ncbi:hypothetical protein KP509_25G004300 [Ceratopteris richardii]|uniref:Protein kinase domain-containing protein n=1 Tax=Ceratopteris richardii TaxID=49495 RepID=A0A8T2RNP6_CERRI|nr:hypothetical protein KP509_25G004300 [Ceratopteris richardii]KAH7297631.1 hypothetical protein KP509_25G004300 [Ceratopteris richardii]KAH7297634.1 hypothetical protein KP509_25G004300 [Ceratopteris richardii]KAH7297635.1 hypothetical protein KP509_25G004300 [Ceratopteris richardii]KAH7297636.1 hypothetical protein KP509_25G004300 [Ceratopteris richardii]